MITREIAARMQAEWDTAQNPDVSDILRFEALVREGISLARTTVNVVDAAQNHWDNSGVGVSILSTPDGSAVGDGRYDANYIRKIQIMYLSYKQWLVESISATFNGDVIELDESPRELIMKAPVVPQPTSE